MDKHPLPRLDTDAETLRNHLLAFCRLRQGEIWQDPQNKHIVGCGDSSDKSFIKEIFNDRQAVLAVHDPPYNLVMFEKQSINEFIAWCQKWIDNSFDVLTENSALYIWLGADQNDNFQPLPQFIIMMGETEFKSRSFITMRNQRGYGTQKNWMAIRQELLYYTKGNPDYTVQYTDIPKILKGYYKEVDGKITDNCERGKSPTIRSGNVWVDIQQVFYRMQENVNGCYGQKPLKSIERIIKASSSENDIITDFFSHSGTTLIAAEKTNRQCITIDIDPIFTEITIRRLEHFRETGKTGWQASNPFMKELSKLNQKELVKIGIIT